MINHWIAEGICDNVPTAMIEDFVEQLAETVVVLRNAGDHDLADEWDDLKDEIQQREQILSKENE